MKRKNECKTIVFHAHEFCLKEGGPGTKRIDSFARNLTKKYNVIILTGKHNKKKEYKEISRDYKIFYCPIISSGKKSAFRRFLEHISFAITSFFVGITKVQKVDYVVTTSPPPLISYSGYLISKIKRSKLIYDVRDIWPDVAVEMNSFTKNSIYYKIFYKIANFMYKKSDFITTVSPGKVMKIKNYCKELKESSKKVLYIPNGLDDEFLESKINSKLIKEYNLDKKNTICYIGNVGLAQNLDVLLDASKKLDKSYQILIFGDGAKKKELENRIKSENINNVKCCGKIDYSDVYTILNNSKISFISLKNNNMIDSIPTKIFDAIGAGCPVLLLASGDSCKIIDETKFGEHINDEKKLKNTICYMIKNHEKYMIHRQESLNIIKHKYMRNKIAKKFEMEVIDYD